MGLRPSYKKVKTTFFKWAPIPEALYAREEELELISTRSAVLKAVSMLYAIVSACFVGALVFYSMPAQYV